MNDLLVKDTIDFDKWMQESEPMTVVHDAQTWESQLGELIEGGNRLTGDLLPWAKTHELIAFRGGEVTLWAGPTGSGKSLVTSFIQLGLRMQGVKSCVGSFEMSPVQTLYRQLRQFSMGSKPTLEHRNQFLSWLQGHMFLYDHVGSIEKKKLFAVIRYAAKVLKVDHFWIDNLMMCVQGEDDYNAQKQFVADAVALSIELNIHIHIVHHVRKLQDDLARASKYDIKGSGAITDLVPQIIMVNRNRKKERRVEESIRETGEVSEELNETPDVFLSVEKHRNGTGWEGTIGLWFDKNSQQYRGFKEMKHIDFQGNSHAT